MSIRFVCFGLAAVAMATSALAAATTRSEAAAMSPGDWPSHLACLKDNEGKLTGDREEEIVVTDAPEQGNVLSRPYPDITCTDMPAAPAASGDSAGR